MTFFMILVCYKCQHVCVAYTTEAGVCCRARPTIHHIQLSCRNEAALIVYLHLTPYSGDLLLLSLIPVRKKHAKARPHKPLVHILAPYTAWTVVWHDLEVLSTCRCEHTNKFCRAQKDKTKWAKAKALHEHTIATQPQSCAHYQEVQQAAQQSWSLGTVRCLVIQNKAVTK